MALSETEELEMLRLRKQKALASTDAPAAPEYGNEGRRSTDKPAPVDHSKDGIDLGPAGNNVGIGELGLQILSGLPASIVAGFTGLGKAGYNIARGKPVSDSLADAGGTAHHVQEAMTYEPRTKQGKQASEVANLPMEVANKLLGNAGEAIGEAVGAPEAGRTIGENALPAGLALAGGRQVLKKPVEAAEPRAGKDYTPLRQLSMEEEERYRRQKDQGVKPTLGSVTRKPDQVRFEGQTAQTEAGAPLYQRGLENDAALVNEVKGVKEQPGPVGPNVKGARDTSAGDTGRAMRKAAESKKAALDQGVNEAYDKARASGETKALVDLDPIKRFLADHEAEAISVPELNSVKAMVKTLEDKAKKAQTPGMASIEDLENIRQRIGKFGMRDGSVKSYMGKLRDGIDAMTEGAGGDLYKAARAKRRAVGLEFEEQGAVADLIDKKSATDYKVAGEDVWKNAVVSGSTDDLAAVIKTLRTAGEKQKPESLQSLKDMQARAIDMILEEGTKTGPVSKAGLERGIKSIGEEKLNLLIGKDAVAKLRGVVKTTEELKSPPLKTMGSDTKANMAVDAERAATDHGVKLLKGVLPTPLRYAAKGVEMVREMAAGRAAKDRLAGQVDEALTPTRASPADIQAEAQGQSRARRKYLMSEYGKKTVLPAAAVEADQE
jgi:hypothetical protein